MSRRHSSLKKIRLGINYYHLTTCVAAIALALVLSLMAQAQDQDSISASASDMSDTNQLANPEGTSSGTTFSDSVQEKNKKSAIRKEGGMRNEMQKAHDTQALGATPTPTPKPQ